MVEQPERSMRRPIRRERVAGFMVLAVLLATLVSFVLRDSPPDDSTNSEAPLLPDARVAPPPVVEPAPSERLQPRPDVTVPDDATADPLADATDIMVQIGVFRRHDSARRLYSELVGAGFTAQIILIDGPDGEPLHRLRVGPYPDEAAARAALPAIAAVTDTEPMLVADP